MNIPVLNLVLREDCLCEVQETLSRRGLITFTYMRLEGILAVGYSVPHMSDRTLLNIAQTIPHKHELGLVTLRPKTLKHEFVSREYSGSEEMQVTYGVQGCGAGPRS